MKTRLLRGKASSTACIRSHSAAIQARRKQKRLKNSSPPNTNDSPPLTAQLTPFADHGGRHQHACTTLRPLTAKPAAAESRLKCARFNIASMPLSLRRTCFYRDGKSLTHSKKLGPPGQ